MTHDPRIVVAAAQIIFSRTQQLIPSRQFGWGDALECAADVFDAMHAARDEHGKPLGWWMPWDAHERGRQGMIDDLIGHMIAAVDAVFAEEEASERSLQENKRLAMRAALEVVFLRLRDACLEERTRTSDQERKDDVSEPARRQP